MSVEKSIKEKLIKELNPSFIVIHNESHKHKGHAGNINNQNEESHFKVIIKADIFASLSKIARQKLVYKILADELKTKIHALQLELS